MKPGKYFYHFKLKCTSPMEPLHPLPLIKEKKIPNKTKSIRNRYKYIPIPVVDLLFY